DYRVPGAWIPDSRRYPPCEERYPERTSAIGDNWCAPLAGRPPRTATEGHSSGTRGPATAIDRAASVRTWLVADPAHTYGAFLPAVEAALRGGVSMVQLRAKGLTDRELIAYANALRDLCTRFDALFVMNDRVDIALSSKAHGVHLGVDDLPLQAARELGGPEM